MGTCAGRTPGYWKTHATSPPWVTYTPTQIFNTLFNPDPSPTGLDLLCVLNPGCGGAASGPPFDVARHLVAALLNNSAGLVPNSVLSVAAIQNIWHQFATTGSFSPKAGVNWDNSMITTYLCTTMPV